MSSAVPVNSVATTGRNSPCPCGSGKRFKDCCGAIGEVRAAPRRDAVAGDSRGDDWLGLSETVRHELSTKMQEALRLQSSAMHELAGDIYRDVLRVAPATHDALHMLGAIELVLGNASEAEQLIEAAMALRPAYGAILRNRDLAVAARILRDRTGDDAQWRARIASRVRDEPFSNAAPVDEAFGTVVAALSVECLHVVGEATTTIEREYIEWFIRRLREVLPAAIEVTRWRNIVTGQAPEGRATFAVQERSATAGSHPRGGTLFVVGRRLPDEAWLKAFRPMRVLLCCGNGTLADYAGILEELHAGTGLPVELVYRSAAERSRFGLPGHVLIPPIVLPDAVETRAGARGRGDAFMIGHVSPRAESILLPRARAILWLQLARAGCKVALYGANRLRYFVGLDPAIEVRSRQIESLPKFLSGLDCLVYDATPRTGEDCGRELFTAMALGIPVLCSSQSCFAEYIDHGGNGYVYRHEMDAVRIAIELRANPSVAMDIGDAAREWSRATLARVATADRYRAMFWTPEQPLPRSPTQIR